MVDGKKTLIFDLDGTLLDSIEDIAVSMNKVLESLNLPIHKIEDYKYFVGSGVDVLVENALGNHSQEIKDEVIKRFKVEYDGKLHLKTLP
ncbi:HAD hydrolase-like protein, partial [Aliarcobacter butzleri]|nr:HAD hydrolase-like protein [Aliarcobacter butzleri]